MEHSIILDTQATPAYRIDEARASKTMLERVEARFDLKPERLIGDTAYDTAPMLGWLVEEKHIAPHVPVCDHSQRKDGTISVSDFQWDAETDEYRCPAGNSPGRRRRNSTKLRTGVTKANTIIYRSSSVGCETCELKPRCCPNTSHRKIARSIHEAARDVARRIGETSEYRQSCYDRKTVEMLFAHLKRIPRFDRLRLRGLSGANDEFPLVATVQNLRKLAMARGQSPPSHGISVPV